MKNNKRITNWGFIIGLFILFLTPNFFVDAKQTVKISGDEALTPNTTIKYDIVIESDDDTLIKGFKSDVIFDTNVLTLDSIELASGWDGETDTGSSPQKVSFNNAVGVTGNFKVATLVFKTKSDIKTKTTEIKLEGALCIYQSVEDEETTVDASKPFDETTSINVKIRSTDNTLSDLKVNDETIKDFSSTTYEYDISVPTNVETLTLTAVPNSKTATLKNGSGNRTVNLDYGSNVFVVTVISESGTERNYTINVTREDGRSTDTTLTSISVDGKEISNFKSTTYKYNLKKYQLTLETSITATTHDALAKYVVNAPKEIIEGDNVYTIVVTSEKGQTATYTIVITNITTQINKKLNILSVKGYDIDFDRNNNRYEIMYNKNKFKDLHVYYTTIASSDEVTTTLNPDVNNDSEVLSYLKPGDVITITITGIDGESVVYTIAIVKDTRVSFYLIFEVIAIVIIIIIIIIVAIIRNSKKKRSKVNSANYKTTKVVKKPKEEVPPKRREDKNKKQTSNSAVPIVETPKKKRFSIFEDEYEEVEVTDDEDDEYSTTKELTDEDLNLK